MSTTSLTGLFTTRVSTHAHIHTATTVHISWH